MPTLPVANEVMEREARRIVNDVLHAKHALSPEMVAWLGKLLNTRSESWLTKQAELNLEQNNEYRKRVEMWIVEGTRIRFWQLSKKARRQGYSKLFDIGMWTARYYDSRTHILSENAYFDLENEDGVAPTYGFINIEPDVNDSDIDFRKLGELVAEWESEHRKVGIFVCHSTAYFVRGESQRAISSALHDLKQRINNSDEVTVIHRDEKPISVSFDIRYGTGGTVKEAEAACFNRPIPKSISPAPAASRPATEKQVLQGLPAWLTRRAPIGQLLAKAELLTSLPHWFLIYKEFVPGNLVQLSGPDEMSDDHFQCMVALHDPTLGDRFDAFIRIFKSEKDPELAMATNLLNFARSQWRKKERLCDRASKIRRAIFKRVDLEEGFRFMWSVDNRASVNSIKTKAGRIIDLTVIANFYYELFKNMIAIERAFGLVVDYRCYRFPLLWSDPYGVQKWISEKMGVLHIDSHESTGAQQQIKCFDFQLVDLLIRAGFVSYKLNPEDFFRARWVYHNRLAWLAHALCRLEHYRLVRRGQIEPTPRTGYEINTRTFGRISGLSSHDMQRFIFNYYAKEDYLFRHQVSLAPI